jgi:TonB family protein
MWARTRVFAFLMLVSLQTTALVAERPVEDLSSSLVDKIVTLKVACQHSTLNFSPEGRLKNSCPLGIWTLDSGFQIAKLNVSGNRLILSGKRIGFGWKSAQKQNFNIDAPLTVEIEFPQTPTFSAGASAVNSIFVRNTEDHAAHVPEFWAIYLRGGKKPQETVKVNPSPEQRRVSSGVAAGRIKKKTPPIYPALAKNWRVEGKVILGAIIGKDGKIKDLHVSKPAGLGLDEAAENAVKHWEYVPYMLFGEPVEVETQVEITFTLSGGAAVTLGPDRP